MDTPRPAQRADVGIRQTDPFRGTRGQLRHHPRMALRERHGWRGNVLLFKRGTVRDVHQIKLPGLEPRGALVAEIDLDEKRALRVIAAHLGLLRRSRSEQARVVLDIMAMIDQKAGWKVAKRLNFLSIRPRS